MDNKLYLWPVVPVLLALVPSMTYGLTANTSTLLPPSLDRSDINMPGGDGHFTLGDARWDAGFLHTSPAAGTDPGLSLQSSTAAGSPEEVTRVTPIKTYDACMVGREWFDFTYTIEASQGRLYYNGSKAPEGLDMCSVELVVPADHIILLHVDLCNLISLTFAHFFSSTDEVTTTPSLFCYLRQRNMSIYSLSHRLVMEVVPLLPEAQGQELALTFHAVHPSRQPRLQVAFPSPSWGYIQTPGWDGSTRYPALMKSCVEISPPSGRVVFYSFTALHLDIGDTVYHYPGHCAYLSADSAPYVPSLHQHTGARRPGAFLFPPFPGEAEQKRITLSFLFYSDNIKEESGFRIRFSFHAEELRPRRVAGGQWNCSVAVWPDLHRHFGCDLLPQCGESEDEAPCPYTSPTCGLNQLEAGGRCYLYRQEGEYSWNEADQLCQQHSSFLVSLETPREWTEVTRLLHFAETDSTWLGLTEAPRTASKLAENTRYRNTWVWRSDSVAYYLETAVDENQAFCGMMNTGTATQSSAHKASFKPCKPRHKASILCEMPLTFSQQQTMPVSLPKSNGTGQSRVPLVTCPLQHVTNEMLACDVASACWTLDSAEGWFSNVCRGSAQSAQPAQPAQLYFYCGAPGQFVPYTLVCDVRRDCDNGGDEDFCVHLLCRGNTINCGQGQCVDFSKQCDGYQDCVASNLDEANCPAVYGEVFSVTAPAVVRFDRPGGFTVTPLPGNATQCPDTHFQCHHQGYCLPVFVRCNDVNDCPDREDELWCNGYRCPGFYRCRGADRTVCVHVDHLCDGRPQCPRHDDELMCDVTCPESCTCNGLAFTCTRPFPVSAFPQLRYLEARGSGLHLSDVTKSIMLIHLGVQGCGWDRLTDFTMPNLHSLDLSDNLLFHFNFNSFKHMQHLRTVNFANNPISVSVSGIPTENIPPTLMLLNLSRLQMSSLNMETLSTKLPNLQVLELSENGIQSLQGRPLFQTLDVLNLKGCPVSDFTPDVMKGMTSLRQVSVDNFKLCCPAILPDKFSGECFAPSDEISSCNDLLKAGVYRLALTLYAVLAIVGNLGSFAYRVCFSPHKTKTGFAVFVLHLCVSDLFMGVYLAVIGVADQVFLGEYVWSETFWKSSTVCNIAGFLSFLSSEVSAFIIFLITVDRFLVLRFPFSHIRFRATSAHGACVVIWTLGMVLTTVPLLPATSHWEFYHQTGICIPLPVTRADFAGHSYSFSVMIVCNLVLFLLIAVGQSLIFWSVRANAMSDQSKDMNKGSDGVKSKEAIIARRLLTIAMSDFLCWFPIGLCGLLAAVDVVIPGEVNVAMAIFVLPLNSALNPFLYTLNIILETRKKARQRRFCKQLQAYLKTATIPPPQLG